MNPKQFCGVLKKYGFNLFTGVPCSLLKGVLKRLEDDQEIMYVPATREDEAIGIAVGAYFGGMKPVVFMQNSGFGLSINALSSLVSLYRVPLLLLITWRGFGGEDAPEHLIMGRIVVKLLEDTGIDYLVLEKEGIENAVSVAVRKIKEDGLPFALLIKRGVINEKS